MFDKGWKYFIFYSGLIIVILFILFNNTIKEVGSWADWFGAVGTIFAVVLALWQSLFGIQREQRIKDKKQYAKKLIKNVLSLKINVSNVEQIFIVENHPVARQDWELEGSDVDAIIKTASELESDLYILIGSMESDVKLSHIDNFINVSHEHDFLNTLEAIKTKLICLFRSIKSTESKFMEIESKREVNSSHDDLTREERGYFDKTKSDFDDVEQEIGKLEEMIKEIFY